MIRSALLHSSSSLLLLEAKDVPRLRSSSARFASTITCSSRGQAYIPKLEPFSRSRLERIVKDPPLIEKAENDLADYCSTLEGDDSYNCWKAYFELKELERESPKEDVERLILQAGGNKTLIGCLHGVAAMRREKKDGFNLTAPVIVEKEEARSCPIPDGLPKPLQELEEEERGRMPDSPYTRLLRTKGRRPAWYSSAPDHENC